MDDHQQADFVEFYTRRGCPISARLARNLQRRRLPLRFHDIWADDDDAAFVRSVARGHETVPTVSVQGTALVAPSARQVLALLAEQAPHLLPDDDGVPASRRDRLRQLFSRRAPTDNA